MVNLHISNNHIEPTKGFIPNEAGYGFDLFLDKTNGLYRLAIREENQTVVDIEFHTIKEAYSFSNSITGMIIEKILSCNELINEDPNEPRTSGIISDETKNWLNQNGYSY